MSFVLTVNQSTPNLVGHKYLSDVELLRRCSDGRDIQTYVADGIRLVVDQLPHDCHVEILQHDRDDEALCVYFGWGGMLKDENALFEKQQLKEILNVLRMCPDNLGDISKMLTGNFLLIVVDRKTSRAYVINDEWAIRCFYYGANEEQAVISSRAAIIASLLKKPLNGMACISGIRGLPPSLNDTMFHGVYRGGPGQHIAIDGATRRVKLTASCIIRDRLSLGSFKKSSQLLCQAIEAAVVRVSKLDHAMVDLTGGHDSRMIAAALHKHKLANSLAFHVGVNAGDEDGPIAKQIADTLNVNILCRDRDHEEDPPLGFLSLCSVLHDGYFVSLGNARRMWAGKHFYGDYHYHIGGVGGGSARDIPWRHEYLRWWSHKSVDLEYLLYRRMHAKWPSKLLLESGIDVSEEQHNDYFLNPYRTICWQLRGLNKYRILDIIHLFRESQLMARCWAYAQTQTVVQPLLSKEYLDIVLNTQWSHRAFRRLQLEVLYTLNNRLSRIPNDYGMTMRPLRWNTIFTHIRSLCRDITHRAILQKPKTLSAAQRTAPANLIAHARHLIQSGVFPKEIQLLAENVLNDGSDDDKIRLIPAMVGIGEILMAYPDIVRTLVYHHNVHAPDNNQLFPPESNRR